MREMNKDEMMTVAGGYLADPEYTRALEDLIRRINERDSRRPAPGPLNFRYTQIEIIRADCMWIGLISFQK